MPSGNRRIERPNKAESGGRTWLLLLLLMSEARMKRGCAKRKCRVTSISIARRYGTSSAGEREKLCAGCKAARPICRKPIDGAGARKEPAGVPLSRLRFDGYDRTEARCCTDRDVQSLRARGMAAMGPRPHLFFDRLPQSSGGRDELVLELRDLSARYPIDYPHFRLTHRRRDARCDDGTVNGRRRRSGRRSNVPHPIWKGTPS